MLIIDFIYYISVKAYQRGNKDGNGSFFISSLWISLLQLFWLLTFLFCIEHYSGQKLFASINNYKIFGFSLLLLIATNNTYLFFSNRREKILNRFHLSLEKEKIYWILLIVVFFISFFIAGRMAFLSK